MAADEPTEQPGRAEPAHEQPERVLPPTAGADDIVRRWTLWAAGVGLVPLPLVDFAATTGFSLKMLRDLAAYYDVPFRADAGKAAVTALAGGAASPLLTAGIGSLAKAIPIIGLPIAIATGPIFCGSITYAIGRVFTAHFGSGGNLFDFDPERFRDYFQEQVEAGKTFVRNRRKGQSETAATPDREN